MEESDFWGREYLHVDLYGITMGVDYYDLKKIVFVKFKVAQTLQEFDLHESNKTIFDKSGGINMEEAIKANNP
jgi:hypothetical protein